MATETVDNLAPNQVAADDGVYLVGELLGFRRKQDREFGGVTTTPYDLGIRFDGGTIEAIQFDDLESAEAAVAGAHIGDRVAVRVRVMHGVKDTRPWLMYVAVRSSGSSSFASQFGAAG